MGTWPRRVESGGANRDRTDDLLHAMQALSQLSYGPTSEGREFWGTPCAKSNELPTLRPGPAMWVPRRPWKVAWRRPGGEAQVPCKSVGFSYT